MKIIKNTRHFLSRHGLASLVLAMMLAGVSGCSKQSIRTNKAPVTPPQTVVDYGNGWYHKADGTQTLRQMADLYQRDADLVAKLNRLMEESSPASGTMIYIPPSNDTGTVRAVLIKIQGRPELVPKTPWTPQPAGAPVEAGQMVASVEKNEKQSAKSPKKSNVIDHPLRSRFFGSTFRQAKNETASTVTAQPQVPPATALMVSQLSPGRFQWPVRGEVVGKFKDGWKDALHGIEIAAGDGVPVRAARPGKVLLAQQMLGYGNLVLIDHGDGYQTAYGYNQNLVVQEGELVREGQQIASVGRPSQGSASRLFFQIRRNGTPVDPMKFIQ